MAAADLAMMEGIFFCRPTSPCSSPADGSVVFSGGGGGGDEEEDCISRLTDALLSNIISRLPVKDAVRTATLFPRWRHVWASTPLILDDTDLLSDHHGGGGGLPTIADAVSHVLGAHPGPFLSVRLTHTCNYAAAHEGEGGLLLSSWLRVLADKGVQELVLVNRPCDTNADLPADILRVASIKRLDLVGWNFPSTCDLRRGADVFPNLRHLRLSRTDIETADIDRLLLYSRKLDTLAIVSSDNSPPRVWIRSRDLRSLFFCNSVADELSVVVAPMLERLILWSESSGAGLGDDSCTRISIGYVQNLMVLGYLDPRIHKLEIAHTVIEAGTIPSPRSMIPSVKTLALKVRLSVPEEAKMLPSFLGCFPNVETLLIMSDQADEPTGKLNFKFWQEAGPIRCLRSTIKSVVLKNFHGYRSERAFLRFIWERSKLLQKMVFVLACGDDPTSIEELVAKLKSLICVKRASEERKSKILVRKLEKLELPHSFQPFPATMPDPILPKC
ncbi:hypothetical protein ACP70R_040078 [Stipagrostis hirtigluma subsp. patula]